MHVDADRQILLQALHGLRQVVAELDHVAALGHHHADADRIAPGDAHARLRRIGEAAADASDVAEAEAATADREHGFADRLDAVEGPGDAQAHAVGFGFDLPGRRHRILPLQRIEHLGRHQAHGGQPRRADVDVDLFVLHADQLDLLHVRDAAQFARQFVGFAAQVAHAVARLVVPRGEGEDLDLHVAELVVGERALHAGRQRVADVVELLAHLAPGLGHLGLRRVSLRMTMVSDSPGRDAVRSTSTQGVSASFFSMRSVSCCSTCSARARPQGAHHHHLDREVRVFGAAEPEKEICAADHEHDHQ
jgi:hypothetical protein